MFVGIGILVVIGCVLGGYIAAGGHVDVLVQPFEVVIIVGAAIGAFVISNATQPHVLKETASALGGIFGGKKYSKSDYLELLSALYTLFHTAKTKGLVSLEPHVEKPEESSIFQSYPKILHNHDALDFICDYMRLVIMGVKKPHELDSLMDEELETMRKDREHVTHAIQSIADGMPALGIVAAVLGVIHTMGAISEPPEVLGHLIGAALVGTFLGILISYGFVAPMAAAAKGRGDADVKYVECIRQALMAFIGDCTPPVAIEFARKVLTHDVRPSFKEVEATVEAVAGGMRKAA
jgi:chemotaxis protein MotA